VHIASAYRKCISVHIEMDMVRVAATWSTSFAAIYTDMHVEVHIEWQICAEGAHGADGADGAHLSAFVQAAITSSARFPTPAQPAARFEALTIAKAGVTVGDSTTR
jgi:hypothetical protein